MLICQKCGYHNKMMVKRCVICGSSKLKEGGVADKEYTKTVIESEGGKDWAELTVKELREELRSRDLKVGGVKAELVERLENNA